jgi:hypothetical protein
LKRQVIAAKKVDSRESAVIKVPHCLIHLICAGAEAYLAPK